MSYDHVSGDGGLGDIRGGVGEEDGAGEDGRVGDDYGGCRWICRV